MSLTTAEVTEDHCQLLKQFCLRGTQVDDPRFTVLGTAGGVDERLPATELYVCLPKVKRFVFPAAREQ